MKCIAHLTKKDETILEQDLKTHCIQVAEYAAQCVKDIGLYHLAYISGVLHDMGKATEVFNDYIQRAFRGMKVEKGSVIHSYTGLIYILEKYHAAGDSYEKIASEIIGYAIGAHHGLFDCIDIMECNGFDKRLQYDKAELYYDEARENFFSEVTTEKKIE